jgi:opacity protein-like surface antigen
MKKLLLALIILVAFAATTSAQVPTPFSLYAGGLISLPQSPSSFKDAYKNGWHGMAGFGWKLAPKFQAVAKIELHSFGVDYEAQNLATTYPNLVGGTNRMLMFGLDGRFSLGVPVAPIKPFILGGGGMAHVSQTEFAGDPLATSLNSLMPSAQNKMYWNIGAGFELKGTPLMGLFAQIRYVSVQTEGEASSFIPITLGFKFF